MIKLTARIRVPRLEGSVLLVPSDTGGGPLQAKTVYPSHDEQIVAPDEDFYGLVSVTVKPVPRLPFAAVSVEDGGGPTFSYEVVAVPDAAYGFSGSPTSGKAFGDLIIGGNNYYTNANKGVDSSCAICRVNFYSNQERTVTINCINYAESNYDYGLVSTLNTTLSLMATADGETGSETVTKNFKGLQSPDVVPVLITIPAGDSFITIKYIKDSSGSHNEDSLKFAIVM